MEALRGANAFVTGAGSGIGRDLVIELAKLGVAVTAADVNLTSAQETAAQAGTGVTAVACDVTSPSQQERAIAEHVRRHGSLDIAVLNAGIGEAGDLLTSRDAGWRPTLDVDLTAVLDGIRLATQAMAPGDAPRRASRQGVILTVASAGAFFVMPPSPVYAAAKAGVMHATRSLARPLLERGIRIAALCPEFVDTPLVRDARRAAPDGSAFQRAASQPLLHVGQVTEAALTLLTDPARVGQCLVVRLTGEWMAALPPRSAIAPVEKPLGLGAGRGKSGPSPALAAWAAGALARKGREGQAVVVWRLSNDFRAATRVQRVPVPAPVPEGHVVLRTAYAGVNASDVNFTAGRYQASTAEAEAALPFTAGFEAVSVVADVGPGVRGFQVGQPVATMVAGGFSEFTVVPAKALFAVPAPEAAYLALMTSGLTASIGLAECGRLRRGETVLVTAAAGGAGQFAVQLAKLAGCRVVATVGSEAKRQAVLRLGADRAVNYNTEDLKRVLKTEFPKGIDVVWETVGGDMFKVCTDALATKGRLIVVGAMSQYGKEGGWKPQPIAGLPEKLLARSATVTGFFLPHYAKLFKGHLAKLTRLYQSGQLHVLTELGAGTGVEAVPEAVNRLQSGKSIGKVCIRISTDPVPNIDEAKL